MAMAPRASVTLDTALHTCRLSAAGSVFSAVPLQHNDASRERHISRGRRASCSWQPCSFPVRIIRQKRVKGILDFRRNVLEVLRKGGDTLWRWSAPAGERGGGSRCAGPSHLDLPQAHKNMTA